MTDRSWVQGDGGPLIVLQASAAAQWQGAIGFGDSIMNGGNVETDYDVICGCADEVCLMSRYDREMLVLSDGEWQGRMFTSAVGQIVIAHSFYTEDELADALLRTCQGEPLRSLFFTVKDDALRLIVGADDGEGSIYGALTAPITPGVKQSAVYADEDGVIVTINAYKEPHP